MNANPILLQKKYARIIEKFAKNQNISLDEALNFFYHSFTYELMSDEYLTEDLEREYRGEYGNREVI